MGFCSGTDIFDPVCEAVLREPSLSDEAKIALIRVLIIALEDHDWDCQSDSVWWRHPLVRMAAVAAHQLADDEDE